jgi:hypothetical protein
MMRMIFAIVFAAVMLNLATALPAFANCHLAPLKTYKDCPPSKTGPISDTLSSAAGNSADAKANPGLATKGSSPPSDANRQYDRSHRLNRN